MTAHAHAPTWKRPALRQDAGCKADRCHRDATRATAHAPCPDVKTPRPTTRCEACGRADTAATPHA
ncbi:hypothetical protein MYA_0228 [Burkholderia sp. KJ006]|nr:hypothetical protein MYA_0228 [Burkholderia sp. KJ006]